MFFFSPLHYMSKLVVFAFVRLLNISESILPFRTVKGKKIITLYNFLLCALCVCKGFVCNNEYS